MNDFEKMTSTGAVTKTVHAGLRDLVSLISHEEALKKIDRKKVRLIECVLRLSLCVYVFVCVCVGL